MKLLAFVGGGLGLALVMLGQTAPSTPPPTVSIDSLPARPLQSPHVAAQLAKMTPIFNGKTLEGWIQAPVAPLRFASEDVKELALLAKTLKAGANGVAAYLYGQCDDAARDALNAVPANPNEARAAVSAVLRSINRVVLSDEPLYTAERFRGVGLRATTEALRQTNPTGLERARLNRLLLEDAFSAELVQSATASWIVKDGVMASTGACRGSIFTEADYTHYRLVFHVRQSSGNHVPGVLLFGTRPGTRGDLAAAQAGIDALGAVQFQVPNGGHWDYRVGFNRAGDHFTRPVRIRFDLKQWAQVEILVNAHNGTARMAVAQPLGSRGIELLRFNDPAAGKPGPIALQMHNAGLFDEYRDLRIEIDPKEDRLITVE